MKTHTLKTADGQRIVFDHYENGFDRVVIIAHGFFNSKGALLLKELAASLGEEYDVMVMDFRGHGESGGMFYWTSKEYLDLEAVISFAKERYHGIGLIGFSLGAATSLITASRPAAGPKIDSLIAVSAPTEFERIEYRFWELDVENDIIYSLIGEGRLGKGVRPGPFWAKKDKPIECVKKVHCPALFIHGDTDWLIKPWHSEALYEHKSGLKKIAIIKNGPHAEYLIRKNKDEMVRLIMDWFAETMGRRDAVAKI